MKMFNLNRKSNIVCRLIAGLLVCVMIALSMPEIEVKADDDRPSSIEINVGNYLGSTVHVYADADKKAEVNFTGIGSLHVVGFGEMADSNYTYTYNSKIEFSNIEKGASKKYVVNFDYTHMGSVPDNEYPITIIVHGDRLDTSCSLTSKYNTVAYGSLSGYAGKGYASFIEYEIEENTNTPDFTCYINGDASATIAPTATPLEPGTYTVNMFVAADTNHESASKTTQFTISKYTPTLAIPDVTTGGEPHPTCTYATRGGSIATVDSLPNSGASTNLPGIAYKGANDAEYSFTVPTEPGDYSATLVYSSDSRLGDYNNDVTTTFKIALKEGKGTVTVKDTVYGESSVKPEAKSDTNDADKAEFFYKVKNTDDSTYIKDRPTKPGNYVCKAVFPKTGDYDKCEATCIFTIDRGKGVGSLTASDVYVGMEPKTTPTSATNGTTAVKYYYKEKSEDASKYTDKLPTKPGEYTVKAVFPMTDYYYETSAEANFKTSYMPAPTFGLSGTQGKNDFYTDTVSVKAPAGYEVSLSYGKDYKDSINILDGVKYVYFKDTTTGALSDKTAVPAYKMDSVLPVVKGVKNNDTIFKDEYELEITDDYLEMVKVNDQTIPVKDGKATYKLTSDSGEMLYKIEATDQAGHTVTYTITVASPWVKDGFVPAGQIVKLKPGKAYSLKGGKKYKIKGDDTVYNGGSKFYVDKETSLELEEVQ